MTQRLVDSILRPSRRLLFLGILVLGLLSAQVPPVSAQTREGSLFRASDLSQAVEASLFGTFQLFHLTPTTPETGPTGVAEPEGTLNLFLAGSGPGFALPEQPALADFTLDEVLQETDLGRLLQDFEGPPLPRVEHRFRLSNGIEIEQSYDADCDTGANRLPGSS